MSYACVELSARSHHGVAGSQDKGRVYEYTCPRRDKGTDEAEMWVEYGYHTTSLC
jgi:hypothetical protein